MLWVLVGLWVFCIYAFWAPWMFVRVSLPLRLFLKSDGYFWWWWWWWTTTCIVVIYLYIFILAYLDLLFFALSIEYNIAEKWLGLLSRFSDIFIFWVIFIVYIYFYFSEILFEGFLLYIFGNIHRVRFFIFKSTPDPFYIVKS